MRLLKLMIPCLLLGACVFGTSKNAKFYAPSATAMTAVSADYTAFIGINRLRLPKYIDRPQMVTRQKDSAQIHISEYNRWIEFPSVLTTRVLTENLSVLLPAAQIKAPPFQGEGLDGTISVEISNLNVILGQQAELTAWYIVKDKTGKILSQQKFTNAVQIGKTYDDVARGYSQLLAQLSQAIAGTLIR